MPGDGAEELAEFIGSADAAAMFGRHGEDGADRVLRRAGSLALAPLGAKRCVSMSVPLPRVRRMTATWIRWHVRAPRATVYRLLLDAESVRHWVGPEGMTSRVHEFDPTEGGVFRITFTADEPTGTGDTTTNGDTYHGRFARLIPDEQVVGVIQVETDDPAATGKQTITYVLGDAGGGTDIVAMHEGLPDAITPEDNELGWRISLGKLAAIAEAAR